MKYTPPRLHLRLPKKIKLFDVFNLSHPLLKKILALLQFIRCIGSTEELDDYEKRKLGIFNQLNFFQFITGIIIPITALIHKQKFPPDAWFLASLPAIISAFVLVPNTSSVCYRQTGCCIKKILRSKRTGKRSLKRQSCWKNKLPSWVN